MSHLMKGKAYGLVMPKKEETLTRANPLVNSKMNKPTIFGHDSSDSDEGAGGDWVKKSLKVKANNSGLKKQSKIQMAKALEEDPTVFQYDEVYDDIERKKEVEKESKKDVDRKPKYVHNLLKAADERQKEFERRIERQVQKEREKEGDEFADKESFVTSAYRKKMEEIAIQEEEEARMERIESALDVTKQNNMDGFYRHLYRQTMGEEKGQIEDKVKKEEPEESEEAKAARVKEEMKKIKIDEDIGEKEEELGPNFTIKKIDRKKGFRQKEEVESSSDSESGSSDGESDDEVGKKDANNETLEGKVEQKREELKKQKEKREKRKRKIEQDASSSESEPEEVELKKVKSTEEPDSVEDENPEVVVAVEESKPKIDIWKKRTIEDMFDGAVRRYWERKAAREAGS